MVFMYDANTQSHQTRLNHFNCFQDNNKEKLTEQIEQSNRKSNRDDYNRLFS